MNNKELVMKLSEAIAILNDMISKLSKESDELLPYDDVNVKEIPLEVNEDRYSHLANLLNNTILNKMITSENPRICTSDIITEIMKYPDYKPEKEGDIHAKINTLKQYLSRIKKRKLIDKKYKVVRKNENYYCLNEKKD